MSNVGFWERSVPGTKDFCFYSKEMGWSEAEKGQELKICL